MAGVAVQQQLERNTGGRDGAGKNHSDDRPRHSPHRKEDGQRALPHHCAAIVSFSCFNFVGCLIYFFRENT